MRHIVGMLILALLIASEAAAVPLVLPSDSQRTDVDTGIFYLLDDTGNLNAGDVLDRRASFAAFHGQSIQVSREGAMWLYLEITNRTDTAEWYLENQVNVEELALYLPDGSDTFSEADAWQANQLTGNRVPFSERRIGTRRPTVELVLPPGETTAILLRVEDFQSSNVRLRLFRERRFLEHVQSETFLLGLAFGSFAALILYNLLVFSVARERVYLVYALYMLAFFFNQLAQERLFSQYLQPHQAYGFLWFVLFSAATAFFGIEFFRLFMHTRRHTPRLNGAARILQGASVAIGIGGIFFAGPFLADMINVVALLAMAVILVVLIKRVVAGDRLAAVCLAGSIVYLIGTTIEILSALIPVPITPFVVHGQLYGALAQVLFLGFALGRRTAEISEQYAAIQASYRDDLERTIVERTHDLEEMTRQLHRQAVTDPLTGLYNRAELSAREPEFDAHLDRRDEGSSAYVLSVAYLDLDNFKFFNDTYGHGYGDQLLQTTAQILRDNTRNYDIILRLGGDEFAIVMPATELPEAHTIVERIRTAFRSGAGDEATVSLSAGLACSRDVSHPTLSGLIERADHALLAAKSTGKDQTIATSDSSRSSEN